MKSLSILLTFSLLTTVSIMAQTKPASKPATKPATTAPKVNPTAATKPASVSSATSARPAIAAPAPSTVSQTAASPNRQQELYDQYHGVSKKTAGPAPVTTPTAERAASRSTTSATTPLSKQPLSSDGRQSGFRIGVHGGITYPVDIEKMAGIEPSVGFIGGLVANAGAGTVSFQTELNYARYTFKVQNVSGPSGISGAVDQFIVPLLVKFSSGSVSTNRFFLNVGPYGAYVSSASINGQKISLADVSNRFRFGAAAGVGAALKTGPGHLSVELRGLYELGDSEAGFNTDAKTVYPQFTIGYLMPLGGR
jgi:hypothetical protein